jgi:hypothetical protein
LVNGSHSFTATLVGVGGQTISANDTADNSLSGTSNVVNVTPGNTVTDLTVTQTIFYFRNPGTFTATVTVPGTGIIPSGSVTFMLNGKLLATVALDNTGVARFTPSGLPFGVDVIEADYSGDANFQTSISPTITVTSTMAPFGAPLRQAGPH